MHDQIRFEMRQYISFSIFLLLAITGWSQNANFTMDVSQLRAETVYYDIKGSPYYDDTYHLGHVYFRGEKYILFFRFNALEDRVELKDRTRRLFFMHKDAILEPTFGGKTYKYLYYLQDDSLKRGYLVRLVNGETVSLYFKPHKVYKQANSPDHGYEGFEKPEFQDASGYYIQFGQQLPQEIKMGKRHLLKLLKGKEAELEHYIKQQELNLRQEKDVIKLINYYNRISETLESGPSSQTRRV